MTDFRAFVSRLTPAQKRILLVLCHAVPNGGPPRSVHLVTTSGPGRPIREAATGMALVRKGMAIRRPDDRFEVTPGGFVIGYHLLELDRRGKILPRRVP